MWPFNAWYEGGVSKWSLFSKLFQPWVHSTIKRKGTNKSPSLVSVRPVTGYINHSDHDLIFKMKHRDQTSHYLKMVSPRVTCLLCHHVFDTTVSRGRSTELAAPARKKARKKTVLTHTQTHTAHPNMRLKSCMPIHICCIDMHTVTHRSMLHSARWNS